MFNTEMLPPPPIMTQIMVRGFSQDSMGCTSPGSMRHKSALTIACPGAVRERTLSDVNSLAFQVDFLIITFLFYLVTPSHNIGYFFFDFFSTFFLSQAFSFLVSRKMLIFELLFSPTSVSTLPLSSCANRTFSRFLTSSEIFLFYLSLISLNVYFFLDTTRWLKPA